MRLLLDTHAFLWWLDGDRRLKRGVRRLIADEDNAVLVSAASAWEIATKFRLGKLDGAAAVAADIGGAVASQGFVALHITVRHAEMAGRVLDHDPALVAVTGEFVAAFAQHQESLGDRLIQAPDPASLGRELAPQLRGDEFVLLKASRGVRLEEALPFILPESDRQCSTTF